MSHVFNTFRTRALIAGMASVGLLAAIGLSWAAPQAEKDREAKPAVKQSAHHQDEEAIRQSFSKYVSALDKGDVKEVTAFWAPDAEYVTEAGEKASGRDAIGALCKPAFSELKGCHTAGRIQSIKFVRPDVALVDGTLNCTKADGTRESNGFTAVWAKSGEQWLIACARDMPGENEQGPSMAYPHLKQLEWLVGEWVGQGTTAQVQAVCRWAPNQSFLMIDYTVEREAQEPKLVNLRIGWDPVSGNIRSWVFDSLGGYGEGTWNREGRRWSVDSSGALPDGGTASSKDTWEFIDENTYAWHSTDREVDGQPAADIDVKFVRKGK